MAYAVGEESFTDLNGNGLADKAAATPATLNELIDVNGASTDLGEAFLDYNLNGVRDPATEPFVDFNRNGTYDVPDGQFNGVLCNENGTPPRSSSAGTCSPRKSLHVFKQITMVFSGSNAVITLPATVSLSAGTGPAGCENPQPVNLSVKDINGNHMPAGTTIKVTSTNGKLTNAEFTVLNTSAVAPNNLYSFTIQGDGSLSNGICTDTTPSGNLTVTVTTPKGNVTTATASVIN